MTINNEITEELYKPFDDIRSRRGRGGVYDYISWKDVVDRMNQVFGYRWSSNVVSQEVIDGNVIVRINVCVKDTENEDIFCQDGYGGAPLREGEEAATAHKSAYSKALKDACRKWGVGLRLEDDQDNNTQQPNNYQGKEFGVPGGNVSQPSNIGYPPSSGSSAPVYDDKGTSVPSSPTQSAPSIPAQNAPAYNTTNNQAPSVPSAPSNTTNSAPAPSAPVQNTPNTQNTNSAPQQSIPSAPAPSAPAQNHQAPNSSGNPLPTVPTPGGSQQQQVDTSDAEKSPSDPGTITSVQEMAIKNLSKLKGHSDGNVEEFIKNMIDSGECGVTKICPLKQYSYNEAVDIIKTAKKLQ